VRLKKNKKVEKVRWLRGVPAIPYLPRRTTDDLPCDCAEFCARPSSKLATPQAARQAADDPHPPDGSQNRDGKTATRYSFRYMANSMMGTIRLKLLKRWLPGLDSN
jgi:hypothetical protein